MFFKHFLFHQRRIGSITPSSHFLTEAMLAPVEWKSVRHVVECGAGDGVMTREILKRMPKGARLTVYEVHPPFIEVLRAIDDPRLDIKEVSAFNIEHYNASRSIDAVISGLPLSNFSSDDVRLFLLVLRKILVTQGVYVQFQYTPMRYHLVKEVFPDTEMRYELRNIPPAVIYIARQNTTSVHVTEPTTGLKMVLPVE